MKRLITLCLFATLLAGGISATTLEDILLRYQWRIGEPDTAQSLLPDTASIIFLNMAQDKIVRLAGYLPKRTDVTYSSDSLKYTLPDGCKAVEGVMARGLDDVWYTVPMNPYFQQETDKFQYFVGWQSPDTMEIYFKGNNFVDDMTVRVFYRAKASPMDSLKDVCDVPDDLDVEIIEEAASYYEHANHNYQVFQILNQSVRLDMGLLKPAEAARK